MNADFSKGEIFVDRFIVKLRSDTSENWATINPILRQGEPGFDIEVGWLKIGDGATHWLDLDWLRSPL